MDPQRWEAVLTRQAFFEAIEVNAVDAWTLFDSLDADGDHLVSYEERSKVTLRDVLVWEFSVDVPLRKKRGGGKTVEIYE